MIALRAAKLEDCERVFGWNFAPDVRAASKSKHAVTLEEHTRWYARRLQTEAPMWIVLDNSAPVGVVRLDPHRDDAGAAKISIALAPEARGRGIGRAAIREVCARWRRPVVAEIAATNAASLACFAACGFVGVGDDSYQWSP